MDEHMKRVIDTFIESVANFGVSFGISKIVVQIYALLYLMEKPMTLDDICCYLKVSKGTVCINIKYLEEWDAVKKIWKKGERKDYYQVNEDIEKIVIRRLKEGIKRRLNEFSKNLESIEKMLNSNGLKQHNIYLGKFKRRFNKINMLNRKIEKYILLSSIFN